MSATRAERRWRTETADEMDMVYALVRCSGEWPFDRTLSSVRRDVLVYHVHCTGV